MAGRSTGAHAENSQSAGIRQRPGTGYFISDAGIVALALFAHGFGSAAEKKRKYGILTGKNTADDAIYSSKFPTESYLGGYCRQAMVSKSTALNLFRRYLHDTPVHYLVKYRLQEAAKLLATTEKKITVISGETGFENMDYFCKTFKKYYGRTPTEYRRKKQMDTDDREWIVQDVV